MTKKSSTDRPEVAGGTVLFCWSPAVWLSVLFCWSPAVWLSVLFCWSPAVRLCLKGLWSRVRCQWIGPLGGSDLYESECPEKRREI